MHSGISEVELPAIMLQGTDVLVSWSLACQEYKKGVGNVNITCIKKGKQIYWAFAHLILQRF